MSGKIDVKVNVIGADDLAVNLSKAIRKGIMTSAPEIAEDAERTAKRRLDQAQVYWRGVLRKSFDWDLRVRGDRYTVIVKNTAEHAAPIEFGATYEEKGPPLFSLIPWVATKMVGFSLEDVDDVPHADEIETRAEVKWGGESHEIDLANYTDEATLRKAFWLQRHIKENGIDAVRFMAAAELNAARTAADTVRDHIMREIRRI